MHRQSLQIKNFDEENTSVIPYGSKMMPFITLHI